MPTCYIVKEAGTAHAEGAPGACGIAFDSRTGQIVLNPSDLVKDDPQLIFLPSVGKNVAITVIQSSATAKTTYYTIILPTAARSVLRLVRIATWGYCGPNANLKTQTIDLNGATIATTGAVANNGGGFRLEAEIVLHPASGSSFCTGMGYSAGSSLATTSQITFPSAGADYVVTITSTNPTNATDTVHMGYYVEYVS